MSWKLPGKVFNTELLLSTEVGSFIEDTGKSGPWLAKTMSMVFSTNPGNKLVNVELSTYENYTLTISKWSVPTQQYA